MTDIWSLVIFTLMAQCAVGLALFIALDRSGRHSATGQTWVAIVILSVGTLISLTHLSQPLVSFYTISEVANSWLSREILFAGLFGATMLAGALFKINALRWLAPAVGLAFIFVMSSVYLIPNQPQWNTWLTPATFFTTSLLLGSAAKLLLDVFEDRGNPESQRLDILGCLPLILSLTAGLRILLFILQISHTQHVHTGEEIAHAALLMTGAGVGLLCLTRVAAGSVADVLRSRSGTACFLGGAALIFLLVAAAEVCGRAVFYKSYTFFGM